MNKSTQINDSKTDQNEMHHEMYCIYTTHKNLGNQKYITIQIYYGVRFIFFDNQSINSG